MLTKKKKKTKTKTFTNVTNAVPFHFTIPFAFISPLLTVAKLPPM